MSYGVRQVSPDGKTGNWTAPFATRQEAEEHAALRQMENGLSYTVEEVPEPGSTAAHHVEILRERVKELEEVQKAMSRDLLFALEIGQAMREAMRHGSWAHDGEGHLASVSAGAWDRWKASLGKAPSVPVGASEVPGEGGDSDRRRLEALRAFLDGNEDASLTWWEGEFHAVAENVAITAPTLAALADKLMEKKEAKP